MMPKLTVAKHELLVVFFSKTTHVDGLLVNLHGPTPIFG